MNILSGVACTLGCACWCMWLLGRVVTDRFAYLQYLHWIPSSLALVITIVCAFAMTRSKRHIVRNTLWVLALLQLGTIVTQDVALWRAMSQAEISRRPCLRIAHFNANWPGKQSAQIADALGAGLNSAFAGEAPDVLVISEFGGLLGADVVANFAAANAASTSIGRFGIISVVPLLETLLLFDDGKSTAALVRFAEWNGNPPWSTVLVDLPSNPETPRFDGLMRVRSRIDATLHAPPEVILGDFNIVRGGHSLKAFAPTMHHAFDEAGVGLGATYSREWPLWHIDHILLSPQMRAMRYETIDLGVGRHRMQAASIQFRN